MRGSSPSKAISLVIASFAKSRTSNGLSSARPSRTSLFAIGSVIPTCMNAHVANRPIVNGSRGSSSSPPTSWDSPANDMYADVRVSPWDAQKSPPVTPLRGIACASARPARAAPDVVVTSRNGVHRADGSPVTPPGSNTANSPRRARAAAVVSYRSRFTDNATTGPSHPMIPADASTVFPERVGPINATDPRSPCRFVARRPFAGCRSRSSVASIGPRGARRPRSSRPVGGTEPGIVNGRASRCRATRASVGTPNLDRDGDDQRLHAQTPAVSSKPTTAATASVQPQ